MDFVEAIWSLFGKTVEGAVFIALCTVAVVFAVPLIQRRWHEASQRRSIAHAALVDLAKDYYRKRLDAYLEIFVLMNDAIRAVISALNAQSPVTLEEANKAVDRFKNFFWDHAPLLSKDVYEAVKQVNTAFKAAQQKARCASKDGEISAVEFEAVTGKCSGAQKLLLDAIKEDLHQYGIEQSIFPTAAAQFSQPQDGSAVDSSMDLLRFIADREANDGFDYVGRGLIEREFGARTHGLNVRMAIDGLLRDCMVTQYEYRFADGRSGAALSVATDDSRVLEAVGEDVCRRIREVRERRNAPRSSDGVSPQEIRENLVRFVAKAELSGPSPRGYADRWYLFRFYRQFGVNLTSAELEQIVNLLVEERVLLGLEHPDPRDPSVSVAAVQCNVDDERVAGMLAPSELSRMRDLRQRSGHSEPVVIHGQSALASDPDPASVPGN